MANRWSAIFYNFTLALNCLLLFLALFAERMDLPPVLQVAGRAHPLALHFPIVLTALYCMVDWAMADRFRGEWSLLRDALLLSAAASASLAAVMGLFLSREGGYDAALLAWHQWSGIALSLLL